MNETNTFLYASGSAEQFLTPALALVASASMEWDSWSGPYPNTINPSYRYGSFGIGPALRLDDARLHLSYVYQPAWRDGESITNGWGSLSAVVQTVARLEGGRFLFVQVGANTRPGGAGVSGALNVHFTKELQVGAGLSYARGESASSTTPHAILDLSADASYWFTPWIRGLLSYQYIRDESLPTSAVGSNDRLTLSVAFRLN